MIPQRITDHIGRRWVAHDYNDVARERLYREMLSELARPGGQVTLKSSWAGFVVNGGVPTFLSRDVRPAPRKQQKCPICGATHRNLGRYCDSPECFDERERRKNEQIKSCRKRAYLHQKESSTSTEG